MDKSALFQHLSNQEPATLLDLLSQAYDQMDRDQRQWIFGKLVDSLPPAPVDGESLLAEIKQSAYLTSLAVIATPEEFATAAAPLIQRDSHHSFADLVYPTALRLANDAQKEYLEAELQRQKIRTKK